MLAYADVCCRYAYRILDSSHRLTLLDVAPIDALFTAGGDIKALVTGWSLHADVC
jgi:hypothetical protein